MLEQQDNFTEHKLNFNKVSLGIHCLSRSLKTYYEVIHKSDHEYYVRFFQILENGMFQELGDQIINELNHEYRLYMMVNDDGIVEPLEFTYE